MSILLGLLLVGPVSFVVSFKSIIMEFIFKRFIWIVWNYFNSIFNDFLKIQENYGKIPKIIEIHFKIVWLILNNLKKKLGFFIIYLN